jgi:hypothetical protein
MTASFQSGIVASALVDAAWLSVHATKADSSEVG